MGQIFGKGVSKGVAAGPISFYRRASGIIPRHEVSDTAAELERFRTARETAKEQLAKLYDKALAEAGEDAAMLFEAHQMNTMDEYVLPTFEKNVICSSLVLLLTMDICHASTKMDATSAISVGTR